MSCNVTKRYLIKEPRRVLGSFTDAWEQRKLEDISDVTKLAGFEFTEHIVYSDEGNTIALRGLNVKNGRLVNRPQKVRRKS